MHYKLVKVTINALDLGKVILNIVVWHHNISNSMVSDWTSVFISKFWSSLCYFLGIKWRLSTSFYLQTDGQTEWQNSTIKVYLRAFINFEQDDWAKLLPMTKFAYNNAKNVSTGHNPFELNCDYHFRVLFEEDISSHAKSKSTDELLAELWQLMTICQQNLLYA